MSASPEGELPKLPQRPGVPVPRRARGNCARAGLGGYLSKISGPLLDRINIQIEVPAVPWKELRVNEESESSSVMSARVVRARDVQLGRCYANSRMPTQLIRKQCVLDDSGERTLEIAMRKLSLSARAHDRILKVARLPAPSPTSTARAASPPNILRKLFSIAVWIAITGIDQWTKSLMGIPPDHCSRE